MNREPTSLHIFRYLIGLGIFGFMGMLYWSSNLIEQDLHHLQSDITQIKSGVEEIKRESSKEPLRVTSPPMIPKQAKEEGQASLSHNLLLPDPFFEKTLPKLLGPNFRPHGKMSLDTIGKPKNLHPFSNWSEVANWGALCTPYVANNQFGKWQTLTDDMAISMEKINETDFRIKLRKGVFWQPLRQEFFGSSVYLAPHFFKKHPVTAWDYKFYVDALMNPAVQEGGAVALRDYLEDIQSIEVIDDVTFIVRWKSHLVDGVPKIRFTATQLTGSLRPLASFVYQYFANGKKIIEDAGDPDIHRKNVLWAENFNEHWAQNIIPSSGAWAFNGMSDTEIHFLRNEDYFQPLAALTEEQVVTFRENPSSIWEDFKSGKTDLTTLTPSEIAQWEDFSKSSIYQEQKERGQKINRLDYLVRSYSYIGWNEKRAFFQSPSLRRAMTMAIDRRRLIDDILNGMGVEISGPFFIGSNEYDERIKPRPFDPEEAKRILEDEGWFLGEDGIRYKNISGKKVQFSFHLTYFVKNPTTQAMASFVATNLKEIGVECIPYGVDISDLTLAFDDKSFDALILGWTLGPPPSELKQIWHSRGALEKGSSNAVGFQNEKVDKIIDKLLFESDLEKRRELYHQFHRIIYEEAPYTFLYTPKTALLYREYVQNVFIPKERQDLVPGADVDEPQFNVMWIKGQKI